jgi:uncharacterized protein YegP (UPF0339 family)
MAKSKVELYRDEGEKKRWRWRVRAGNSEITASSGESFWSKWNAKRAAKKQFPDAEIVTVDEPPEQPPTPAA